MISNESLSILGPGPAAYENLKPLKSLIHKKLTKGSPVMKQPSALDERVKKLLNVSSTEDLQNKKLITPGPGEYEGTHLRLQMIGGESSLNLSSNEEGKQLPAHFHKRAASGLTIPKY